MTQADPFGAPQTSFISIREDFMNRLILMTLRGIECGVPSTAPGSKEGTTYDRVIADVVVLDGPITQNIDAIPCKFESMFLSGGALVPMISKPVGGGKRVIEEGKMILARVGPFKNKFGNTSATLVEATDQDKVTGRQYLASLDPFA